MHLALDAVPHRSAESCARHRVARRRRGTSSSRLPQRALAGAMAPPARVLVVAGPTAVGKSSARLEAVRSPGRRSSSAHSVQLYRGFDVGSNKPSPAELQRVRHHLVDVADASNPWSAGAGGGRRGRGRDVGMTDGETARRRRRHDDVRPMAGAGRWTRRKRVRHSSGLGSIPRTARRRLGKANAAVAGRLEACARASRSSRKTTSTACRARWRSSSIGRPAAGVEKRAGRSWEAILTCAARSSAPADWTALYHAIDERCDTMPARGLLEETANPRAAGRLPASSGGARHRLPPGPGLSGRRAFLVKRTRRSTVTSPSAASFRPHRGNYAAEQLKWYRRDATFAIVPAGDDGALATLLDLDRGAYDAFLRSDAQAAAARNGLAGDPKAMKTSRRGRAPPRPTPRRPSRVPPPRWRFAEASPFVGGTTCGWRSCGGGRRRGHQSKPKTTPPSTKTAYSRSTTTPRAPSHRPRRGWTSAAARRRRGAWWQRPPRLHDAHDRGVDGVRPVLAHRPATRARRAPRRRGAAARL